MHHYSPSPRWLAVPGIGFPQNISVGPNVLDPEHFRDRSFTTRCKTDGQHDAAAQLIDCIARKGRRRLGPPSPSDGVAQQPSLTYCFFHSSADIGLSLTP